jgi:hypothetical protein
MSPETILGEIRRRPFVPFRVHESDGTTYEIRHPELILLGPRDAIIGIPRDPAVPLIERHEIVSLLHITRLEPIPVQQGSGNGQG